MKLLKKILSGICAVCMSSVMYAIDPGIADFAGYESLLAGKKIGMVANQTSVVGGQHSVDFLRAHGVNLVRVFAPSMVSGEMLMPGRRSGIIRIKPLVCQWFRYMARRRSHCPETLKE